MAGFDTTVFGEITSLITYSWTKAVGDSRLTAANIWTSQGLEYANYENLQNAGTLNTPFAIVVAGEAMDAPDTPCSWFAVRQNVAVIIATSLSDPAFAINPAILSQGILIAPKMGTVVEIMRQAFMLHRGSFKCYSTMPSTTLSTSMMANHSFYALIDGKFSGCMTADILTAQSFDPSNPV